MRILKNVFFGLFLVIVGIVMLMLLPSPQAPAEKPWEITTMPDGNSQVLGIHLGKTDYQTAQARLGVVSETALFVDPDGQASVEAYFDSVNLGGLSAKLVLNLGVSDDRLALMLNRASAGELRPSGAHQHVLAAVDRDYVLNAPVQALTYIPSIGLSREMIESRFGKATTVSELAADEQGRRTEIWSYPEIGLTIEFHPEQKPILIYRTKS